MKYDPSAQRFHGKQFSTQRVGAWHEGVVDREPNNRESFYGWDSPIGLLVSDPVVQVRSVRRIGAIAGVVGNLPRGTLLQNRF